MNLNKLFCLLPACLLMSVISCTKETPVTENENPATITIDCPSTKVQMGEELDGRAPMLWSAGDEIAVLSDGAISKFVLQSGEGTPKGVFKFVDGSADLNNVQDVVYPYTAASADHQIPAVQHYTAGTPDPQALVMKLAQKGADDTYSLSHHSSVICLQMTSPVAATLESVKASFSEDEAYTLSFAAEEGALSAEPLKFYIVVPASESPRDITFDFVLTDGSIMSKTTSGKVFSAGEVSRFPVLEFTELKVGDLYQGGMVFVTDKDLRSITVMSLDEEELAWSTVTGAVEGLATSPDDGISNTTIITALPGYETTYPAFAFCTRHGKGWYMPSRKELCGIYNALLGSSSIGAEKTNQLLASYGGTKLEIEKVIWSCCPHSSKLDRAFFVKMNPKKWQDTKRKSDPAKTRAVKKIIY